MEKILLVLTAIATLSGCQTISQQKGNTIVTTNLEHHWISKEDLFTGNMDYLISGNPIFGCTIKPDGSKYAWIETHRNVTTVAPGVKFNLMIKRPEGNVLTATGASVSYDNWLFINGVKPIITDVMNRVDKTKYMFQNNNSDYLDGSHDGSFSVNGMMDIQSEHIKNLFETKCAGVL